MPKEHFDIITIVPLELELIEFMKVLLIDDRQEPPAAA